VRKAYFGMFFDFGRSPVYPVRITRNYKDKREREAPFRFVITWKGISDAKRAEFIDKIGRLADIHPVVLYDSTNVCLNGFRTIHARIEGFSITPVRPNSSEIEVTFNELV
jgi:hypothetical protein